MILHVRCGLYKRITIPRLLLRLEADFQLTVYNVDSRLAKAPGKIAHFAYM